MQNWRFETARLATGPQVHYAQQGDPEGQAVVFLHGWPDSWFSFSRVMPLLSPGWRVFVPDQRGFGDSERPASGYTIDHFAADAVAFLDALGVNQATFVGHSFGSFVTRRVAIAHPERVSRVVLIGTGAAGGNPVTREVQSSIQDLRDPVPIAFARDFLASTVHVPLPESFVEPMLSESLKLPARLWRAVLDGIVAYDDSAELPGIAAPTLLMWGDRDALFSRDEQERVVNAIPGAQLTIYSETGHCPNWERPERVAADVQSFLRQN